MPSLSNDTRFFKIFKVFKLVDVDGSKMKREDEDR